MTNSPGSFFKQKYEINLLDPVSPLLHLGLQLLLLLVLVDDGHLVRRVGTLVARRFFCVTVASAFLASGGSAPAASVSISFPTSPTFGSFSVPIARPGPTPTILVPPVR